MDVFTSDHYIPPMTDTAEQGDTETDPASDPLQVQDGSQLTQCGTESSETQCHSNSLQKIESPPKNDIAELTMPQNDEESPSSFPNPVERPALLHEDRVTTPKSLINSAEQKDYSSSPQSTHQSCLSPALEPQSKHIHDVCKNLSSKDTLDPDSDSQLEHQAHDNDSVHQSCIDESNVTPESSLPSSSQYNLQKNLNLIGQEDSNILSNSISNLTPEINDLSQNVSNHLQSRVSMSMNNNDNSDIDSLQQQGTSSSSNAMSSAIMPPASSTPLPLINNDYCDDNSLRSSESSSILHNIEHIPENGHGHSNSELHNSQSRPNSVYDFDSAASNSEMSMVDLNSSVMMSNHQQQLSLQQQQQQHQQQHSIPHDQQQSQLQMQNQSSKGSYGISPISRCDNFTSKRDILSHLGSMNHMPIDHQSNSINNTSGSMTNNISGNSSLNQSYDSSLSTTSSEFPNTASCYDPVLLRRARGRPRGSKNGTGMGRGRNTYMSRGGGYKYSVDDRTCTAYDLRNISDPFGTARRGRPRSRFIVDLGEQNHEAWTKARLDLNVSDAELTTLLLSL